MFPGGSPYLSFSKNPYYNVGFNSTNAGFLSLLGNAALALTGENNNNVLFRIDLRVLAK